MDVEGNAKVLATTHYIFTFSLELFVQILQAVVQQAKKLSKAVYVFSVDSEGGKVIHVNHVPESLRSNGFDARTWAARVAETLGGKVRSFFYIAAFAPKNDACA